MIKAPCEYDLPLSGLDFLQWYGIQKVFHPGVDFNKSTGDNDCGNAIYAPASGFVEFVEERTQYWYNRGFGKFIILLHADGTYTRYGHLRDLQVRQGQQIKKGQRLGTVGKTGSTQYCHLHFECFSHPELVKMQKSNKVQLLKRPWCFYPVGKHRAWVAEHYLNPWTWLKKQQEEKEIIPPGWAKTSVEFCKAKGLITQFEGNYMPDWEIAVVLRRFYGEFIQK